MEEKNNIVESKQLTLQEKTEQLVDNIINEDDIDKTKEMINLFNVNIVKKNIARVYTLNNLLDKVNDQAIERFEKRPEDVSNKELLDYMSVVQTQIEKSNDIVKQINDSPPIQLNQQNITVNVENNETKLDKESRDRILNAIQAIVKEAKEEDKNIIDAVVESTTHK